MRPARGVRDVARGLGAMLLLVMCLAGIPVLLFVVAPVWQIGVPTWSQLVAALTKPDDGHLFLGALTVVAWLAWAAFTVSVVVEGVAVIRGLPSPRLRFLRLPQRGASVLVAAASVLLVAEPIPSPAAMRPVAAHAVASAAPSPRTSSTAGMSALPEPAAPTHSPSSSHGPQGQAAVKPASREETTYRTVTVERGDTLWGLAERFLGAGSRYREIAELNYGRPQRDGRTLTAAHWIYPGWVLRIPLAAMPKSPSKAPIRASGTYTVGPGDTLWGIADKRLGDGSRYDEIERLNAGRPQAAGGRLVDADEIQPGWVLRLPAPAGGPDPTHRPEHQGPRSEPPDPRTTPSPQAPSPPPREAPLSVATPDETNVVAEAPFAVNRLALGLSALAAAGVVVELALRRRRQQRVRRAGERLPMPAAEAAEAEQELRAVADPVTVETVQCSLRQMAAACRARGRALPRVAAVRVSQSGLALLLAEEAEAIEPFQGDGPRRWVLTAGAEKSQYESENAIAPCPALVTLGVTDDDVVLINLEAAGVLAVVGDQQTVRDVVRALAVELATSPLAGRAVLVLPEWMSDLAGVVDGSRACVASGEEAKGRVVAHASSVGSILKDAEVPDLNQARSLGVASDVWAPLVLVSDRPIVAKPWAGVASIQAAASEVGWTLEVDHDGSATLSPLGIDLDAQRLRESDSEQIVGLLRTSNTPPAQHPSVVVPSEPWGDDEGPAGADVILAALPETADLPSVEDASAGDVATHPRILVLGRVDIEGVGNERGGVRRARALELLAYLALHPGAGAIELDEALWPGRRVPKETRNPFVSRVRHWLGVDRQGEPYLPLVGEHGDYRLSPEVGCDWHDFLKLARIGLERGPEGADLLAEALTLVRGRPFLGIDPANYAWAERDTQEMISAIVDVAHALAVLRLTDGDGRGAQLAAAVGLLAEPCSELLHRDAIAGARLVGDLDAADVLITRLRVALSELDPDYELEPETLELIADVHERDSRRTNLVGE